MGRRCKWEGCITILGDLNENPCCHAHQLRYVEAIETQIREVEAEIRRRRMIMQSAEYIRLRKLKIKGFEETFKHIQENQRIRKERQKKNLKKS